MSTTLAQQMRAAAQSRQLPTEHEIYQLAELLDTITAETPVPVLLARWARARRAYCALTGEPLV